MSVQEVTVADLEAAIQAGARVVDVREVDEYTAGHVPGAVLVVLGTVPDHIDDFRAPEPVYVVCRSGARSMRACEFLAQQGITAINVAGGTLEWVASGRAVALGSEPL